MSIPSFHDTGSRWRRTAALLIVLTMSVSCMIYTRKLVRADSPVAFKKVLALLNDPHNRLVEIHKKSGLLIRIDKKVQVKVVDEQLIVTTVPDAFVLASVPVAEIDVLRVRCHNGFLSMLFIGGFICIVI